MPVITFAFYVMFYFADSGMRTLSNPARIAVADKIFFKSGIKAAD